MGNSKSRKSKKIKSSKRSKDKKTISQSNVEAPSKQQSVQKEKLENVADIEQVRASLKNKIWFSCVGNSSIHQGANIIIGEYYDNIIPISLKNRLKSEIKSLSNDKSKLNYRNLAFSPKYEITNIEIQDLIEPSNPFKANNLLKDGELISTSIDEKDLMALTVITTIINLIEERIWIIDDYIWQTFNADYCYKNAMREDIPWRQWLHYVREMIVTYLRANNRIIQPTIYYGMPYSNDFKQPENAVNQTENVDSDNKNDVETENKKDIEQEIEENVWKYFNKWNPENPCKHFNQWIPTIFRLNQETNLYEIIGEINDLPRNNNATLYGIIQAIFNKFIPNINRCLHSYPLNQYQKQHSCSDTDYNEYYVIIKLSDYQFMDKTNSWYGGSKFHSIGFSGDGGPNITAVALYYFDISSNIQGGDLSFKYQRDEFSASHQVEVNMSDNLCVFYSNKYVQKDVYHAFYSKQLEYKVTAMNITDTTVDENSYCEINKYGETIYGTRKTFGFFIVDPTKQHEIMSTNDIIVNIDGKISLIINYWIYQLDEMKGLYIVQDIVDVICMFICGDMKYMKDKHDYCRSLRYGKLDQYKYCANLIASIEAHKQYIKDNPYKNQMYYQYPPNPPNQ